MNSKSLINAIVLQVAERIRDLSTIQGRIPFLSGDLRKSITAQKTGPGEATVSSNLVYARAVHDGRKEITIVPKKAKMLAWPVKVGGKFLSLNKGGYRLTKKSGSKSQFIFAKSVTQKARAAQPFLQEGADDMAAQGFDFLNPLLHEYVSAEIGEQIKDSIELNFTV